MEKDERFKATLKTMLDTAMVALAMRHIPLYDADDLRIIFCVTCFKREDQLVAAMMVNVSLWWSLRKYWRLVIVTFADDWQVQRQLQKLMKLPIDTGNVVLASGGDTGQHLARSLSVTDRPVFMPQQPRGEHDPHVGGGPDGMPLLRYWHASVAKNSSHGAARFAFPGTKSLLVNLDCDQIVPTAYVEAALQAFHQHQDTVGFCLVCSAMGALTGRLGYRMIDFVGIGGYDEAGPPSSGQDVDIRRRLKFLAEKVGVTRSAADVWLESREVCGVALPNDFGDITRANDRGYSKVRNCDPDVLSKLGCDATRMWETMKTRSQSYWDKLWKKRDIYRNLYVRKDKSEIGAWWIMTQRKVLPVGKVQHLDDAEVTSEVSHDVVDMDDAGIRSPRQTPGAASSTVWIESGISIEVFIVGAQEIEWKVHTEISSLGPSDGNIFVGQFLVTLLLCLHSLHHNMCECSGFRL